ncbi:MAG TPA: radical SAM protein [Gemmatimonadaceae bacterium]|nr:radical SAM protein [Gemmatimonadaceae bacterium]
MLSERFKPWHVPLFAAKYAYLHLKKFPILVHFEVTMRCNAHCSFCDYWKTPAEAKQHELKSFADAARYFNPLMITFTGGEPTLRRDLEDLIAAVNGAVRLKYLSLITHGGMLSPERARSLWKAGLNQFSISLDFLDERHDQARGIPGLTQKIFRTIPKMREMGIDNIRFNTVIKDVNLDHLMDIVRRAEEMGVGVAFSTYTDFKNGNTDYYVKQEQLRKLDEVIAELLAFKRAHRGVIVSSDHYLRQVPKYFRGEMKEPCFAGVRTIHINPTGHVRRCPDFPNDFHWTEFKAYKPIDCNACFYACRGESQAPLTISRIRDVMA